MNFARNTHTFSFSKSPKVGPICEPLIEELFKVTRLTKCCSHLTGLAVSKQFYIVNKDDEDFDFFFVESSLFSGGCQDRLVVNPVRGTVAQNNK